MLYRERFLVSSLEGWNQTLQIFKRNLLKTNENIDADGKITILVTNTYQDQGTKWLMVAIVVFDFRSMWKHNTSKYTNRNICTKFQED